MVLSIDKPHRHQQPQDLSTVTHRRCHTDTSIAVDYLTLDLTEDCSESSEEFVVYPAKGPQEEAATSTRKILRKRSQSECSLQSFQTTTMALSAAGSSTEVPRSPLKAPLQIGNESSALNTQPLSPSEEQQTPQDLLPLLLDAVEAKEWNRVLEYLERDPSLAKRQVSMVCQGENSKCLLVHLLSTGTQEAPLSVVDSLVTLHPASLTKKDARGHRTPLHLSILTGASEAVVNHLRQARPQALETPDQEGNYPLHYAAMYGDESTIRAFVEAYPAAAKICNGRDRLPVHLLCARCFDDYSPLTGALQVLVEAHPDGLQVCDRFGRTPLHLAACARHVQWDFMEKLVEIYPKALTKKDKSGQIPLQLARKINPASSGGQRHQQNNILLSTLEEVTVRERRKAHPYRPFVGLIFSSPARSHRKRSSAVDLYHCYG